MSPERENLNSAVAGEVWHRNLHLIVTKIIEINSPFSCHFSVFLSSCLNSLVQAGPVPKQIPS